jgi:hypothetical protein
MSETLINVLDEATTHTIGIWVRAGFRIKRIVQRNCTAMTFAAASAAAIATASAAAYTRSVRRRLRTKVRRVCQGARTLVAGFVNPRPAPSGGVQPAANSFDLNALVRTSRRYFLQGDQITERMLRGLGRRQRDESDAVDDSDGDARASSRRRIQ